ncbi:CBS domain-containing protein [Iocasia frigidifontis]|uniref:CBS domain-containing protein n=1 Tax=Iocasia fonsfrigidae TaxID=2682810 RepID=A0A8A7K7E8_9FIRM|nr:sugar phosphate nucleotidyltransferase [Iocasia fonsfrigidae]QTL97703.1 CBS domain-containing protein [Iocasia fonsfrigidae]
MNIRDLFINEGITIKEAIKKIDETANKILLITRDTVLKGVITDGDIRRWILMNGDLNEKVKLIMNHNPVYLMCGEESKAKDIMRKKLIEAIPVVNEKKEVINIILWKDLYDKELKSYNYISSPVVIMAGGKGTRLDPITKVFPKPLVPIGNIPVVERIINRFIDFGCEKFYLTINYKKNLIKAYFNDLDKNYEIEYIEEEKPLGTAGSLYLLKDKIKEPFFVSNCDILIGGNYYKMLKFHQENKNKITVITSLKFFTVPYGVIELNEESIIREISEKPEFDFLINTGMYILEPETLTDIPVNKFYHLTDLIKNYIKKGERVGAYPVSEESWLDMGQFKEMKKMLESLGF